MYAGKTKQEEWLLFLTTIVSVTNPAPQERELTPLAISQEAS
jgi:hypothetical protein